MKFPASHAIIESSEFEFVIFCRRSWSSRRHDVRILRVRHTESHRAGSARKLPGGSAGQGRHTWTPHHRRIRISGSNKRQLRARPKPPYKACIFWLYYLSCVALNVKPGFFRQWKRLNPSGSPPFPCDKLSAFDYNGKTYLFGGYGPQPEANLR